MNYKYEYAKDIIQWSVFPQWRWKWAKTVDVPAPVLCYITYKATSYLHGM